MVLEQPASNIASGPPRVVRRERYGFSLLRLAGVLAVGGAVGAALWFTIMWVWGVL